MYYIKIMASKPLNNKVTSLSKSEMQLRSEVMLRKLLNIILVLYLFHGHYQQSEQTSCLIIWEIKKIKTSKQDEKTCHLIFTDQDFSSTFVHFLQIFGFMQPPY